MLVQEPPRMRHVSNEKVERFIHQRTSKTEEINSKTKIIKPQNRFACMMSSLYFFLLFIPLNTTLHYNVNTWSKNLNPFLRKLHIGTNEIFAIWHS